MLSQRLLPRKDSAKMVPAIEVMLVNQLIKNVILEGDSFDSIHDAIHSGHDTYGMMSFDLAITELLTRGLISEEEALSAASSPSNLKLLMSGVDYK